MTEPVWLLERAALAAHVRVLNEHGGRRFGCDLVRLAMALALPKSAYHLAGGRSSVLVLATAYAWGIGRMRPFSEANAATACLLAMTFLRVNGVDLPAPAAEKYAVFSGLARGALDPDAVVHWMKTRRIANARGTTVIGVRLRNRRVTNLTVLKNPNPAKPPQLGHR